MYKLLTTVSFFDDAQHSFRLHRFCETQLAHTIGHISHLYDMGVDVLIFSKPFDSGSHIKLLLKLRRLGLHLEILEWVQDFLTARL